MNRRRTLVVIVRSFAIVACVVFAIPFVGVFFNFGPDAGGQRVFVELADLVTGQPRIINLAPHRTVIVLRASPDQLRDLAALSAHVWEPELRADDTGLFVHWAFSTGKFGGCRLQHKPAAISPDPGGAEQSRWLGGYWASGCEASYDYAGRAIKSARHAYGTYVAKSKSLRTPEFVLLDDGRLAVTIDSL